MEGQILELSATQCLYLLITCAKFIHVNRVTDWHKTFRLAVYYSVWTMRSMFDIDITMMTLVPCISTQCDEHLWQVISRSCEKWQLQRIQTVLGHTERMMVSGHKIQMSEVNLMLKKMFYRQQGMQLQYFGKDNLIFAKSMGKERQVSLCKHILPKLFISPSVLHFSTKG